MKKFFALALAAAMVMSMTACGSKDQPSSSSGSGSGSSGNTASAIKIGGPQDRLRRCVRPGHRVWRTGCREGD